MTKKIGSSRDHHKRKKKRTTEAKIKFNALLDEARSLLQSGKEKNAAKILDKIARESVTYAKQGFYKLGRILIMEDGEYEQALDLFAKLKPIDSLFAAQAFYKGAELAIENGDLDEAETFIQKTYV